LGADVNKYIGQELYVNAKLKEDRAFGYSGFYTTGNSNAENVYQPNDKYYTTYEQLAGKYFSVLEIVRHPDAPEGELFDRGICFLKLEEKGSKAVVYFEYNSKSEFSFPFFIVGFYEKQKAALVGRDFVFNDNTQNTLLAKTDIETGKPVTVTTGQAWKCIDVKMPDGGHVLNLVIQNQHGEKTTVPYGTKSYNTYQVSYYRKKFGDDLFNKVLQASLSPGMTKEMCKLAIGEPYKMDGKKVQGNTRDEWFYYNGIHLFFSNEALVEIKNDAKP
jgi:hypothetical protein